MSFCVGKIGLQIYFLLSQYNNNSFQLYLAGLHYKCKRGWIAKIHYSKDKIILNDNCKKLQTVFGILLLIIFLLFEIMIPAKLGIYLIFTLFPLKILCSLCEFGKCLSIIVKNLYQCSWKHCYYMEF